MTHFYESVVIKTSDGMTFKSYANEHPDGFIIAKPKYIPVDKVRSSQMQLRKLDGQDVNRFNYWVDQAELVRYIDGFRMAYPEYFYVSPHHGTWFFCVPRARVVDPVDPRLGVRRLLALPESSLDEYQKLTVSMIKFIEKSGIGVNSIGITNSTLLGNYTHGKSDIDIMIFGTQNYWTVNKFLKARKHPLIRAKTLKEWQDYFKTYNAGLNFSEEDFIWHVQRKLSDGYIGDTVFSLFGVEEPGEIKVGWEDETATRLGLVTVEGRVVDDFHSVVRPGYYIIEGRVIDDPGKSSIKVTKVLTFARDFMLQAFKGETLVARGVLERVVNNKTGESHYRVSVGYFDSYVERMGQEFIKVKH